MMAQFLSNVQEHAGHVTSVMIVTGVTVTVIHAKVITVTVNNVLLVSFVTVDAMLNVIPDVMTASCVMELVRDVTVVSVAMSCAMAAIVVMVYAIGPVIQLMVVAVPANQDVRLAMEHVTVRATSVTDVNRVTATACHRTVQEDA